MATVDVPDRGPFRAVQVALGGALRPGEVGAIVARAGVGKSSLIVHFALERLLRSEPVLHVAATGGGQTVRDAYDAIYAGLNHQQKPLERAESLLAVERYRVIYTTRGKTPDAQRVEGLLETLSDASEFTPRLVVFDNWEPTATDVAELRALSARRGFAVWLAFTPTRPIELDPYDAVLEMVPEKSHIWLHIRKGRAGDQPPVRLEAPSFVAREEDAHNLPGAGAHPSAGDCTLYSGGAHGAEAAFGEAAERWGVREVNYTFDGHVQTRTRGAHPLTEQELAAGEVSLAYVSRRLRRGYGEGSMIRRVLQSLWHQVGSSQVVYVIGAIQEDGTVTGGTGWSVELARMWNKRLWVFDQEKDGWFRWNGDDWVEGTPVIDANAICGTGTRYLSPVGRAAIDALFERTFGPA